MKAAYGFTVIELLAVLAIIGLIAAMAVPNLSSMREQMQVSEAKYQVGQKLAEARAEAIRLKAEVLISFTPTTMRWDYFNDGSVDGSIALPGGVSWGGSTPASFSFDGLGLLRGISGTRTITMRRGKKSDAVQLNKNGYIAL